MSKAVIDGKRYDTETATHIMHGYPSTGGNLWEEDLYLSPKGQFFIETSGELVIEENRIRKVKKGEARKWLDDHFADEATLEAAGLGTVDG